METEKRMYTGELRALPKLEIEGMIPANEASIDMGGWDEKISPYAFKESLGENIFLLYQHKTEAPLASTKSGTLKVWYDNRGDLYFKAKLADTSTGRDLHNLVKSKVIDVTSFGMTVKRDHWQGETRYVDEAVLHEISPVTWASYPSTQVIARNKLKAQQDEKRPFNFFSEESKREMKNLKKFWQEKDFKDHEEFLRTVVQYGQYNDGTRASWDELDQRLASGMDSAGYPTPDNFMSDLLRGPNGSELLRRCTTYQLGDYNNLKLVAVDEKTRSDSQFGGAQSYWVEEGTEITESKPDFRMVNLYIKKLVSFCYTTDELLAAGIDNYVFNTLSVSKARKIHNAMIHGTGAGQWLGIIKSGAEVVADAVGGQAAGTFVAENAAEMVKHLAEGSHGRETCWLINPELYATLAMQQYNGVDQSGNLIRWRAGGAKFSKMLGFDLIPCEACSAPGTVGDIVLADLSQYIVAEKAVKKQISGHVRFYNDESCFKLTYRADGAPAWATPVLSEKSGIKVSPFVVLAARS